MQKEIIIPKIETKQNNNLVYIGQNQEQINGQKLDSELGSKLALITPKSPIKEALEQIEIRLDQYQEFANEGRISLEMMANKGRLLVQRNKIKRYLVKFGFNFKVRLTTDDHNVKTANGHLMGDIVLKHQLEVQYIQKELATLSVNNSTSDNWLAEILNKQIGFLNGKIATMQIAKEVCERNYLDLDPEQMQIMIRSSVRDTTEILRDKAGKYYLIGHGNIDAGENGKHCIIGFNGKSALTSDVLDEVYDRELVPKKADLTIISCHIGEVEADFFEEYNHQNQTNVSSGTKSNGLMFASSAQLVCESGDDNSNKLIAGIGTYGDQEDGRY